MRANIALGRGEQVTAAGITNYNFGYPIESQNDVAVYLDAVRLNLGFDYNISGAGNDSGFTVQLVNDPGAGHNLISLLAVPIAQTLDLVRGGGIPAESLEDKLDLLIEIMQMQEERWQRTIRLNDYSMDENIVAPDYTAGKWWKYDDMTRKITLADPPSGAPGLQGPAGPGVLFGSGAPSGSLGTLNATYIDTATFDVYSKTGASTWTLQGSIKGPKGDPGSNGVSTTVGAARGQLSVAAGDFAAGALSVTVDLTNLALPDTSYVIVPTASWITDFLPTVVSATQATFAWTEIAPADGVIKYVLVAQGALSGSGGTAPAAHDHTSNANDGGVLTRDEHDAYSQYNDITPPAANPPANKIWIYPDPIIRAQNQAPMVAKLPDGSVYPLGYFTHSHSGINGDGGPFGQGSLVPQFEKYFDLKQIAAPGSPAATYHRVYKDSADGHLKLKNNAGTIVDLEAAISGTSLGSYGVRGLKGDNNAGSPNTQFDLTADAWVLTNSSTSAPAQNQIVVIHNPPPRTLNIAVFAAGGRDQSAAFGASNWIYVYGIWNGVTATVLASLTAPPTGPTLPSGYTHWNFLTVLRLDSGANLIRSRVRGNQVFYDTPQNVLTNGNATAETSFSVGSFVPSKASSFGLQIKLFPTITGGGGGGTTVVELTLRLSSGGPAFLVLRPTDVPALDDGFARGEMRAVLPHNPSTNLVFYFNNTNTDSNNAPRVNFDVTDYTVPNDG